SAVKKQRGLQAVKKPKFVTPNKGKKVQRPTPAECEFAVLELGKLHPSVLEKTAEMKQRTAPPCKNSQAIKPNPIQSLTSGYQNASCGFQPTILDGVVSTMLSQNTTAANSTRAFHNLKKVLPDWNVVAALTSPIKIENAVRVAGLAKKRARNIWTICRTLVAERGEASLEYLREENWSVDDIKAELMRFPGLGKKTASCVLMFTIRMFWVPPSYSRDDAYDYLNTVIPNHLKMDLHYLLVQHGRECHRCAARGKPQFPPKDGSRLVCPLVHLNEIYSSGMVPVKKEMAPSKVKKET
ncbi:MAG: hypothetical protein SGILL_010562, partial [Bacillariaceae sp.]